MGFKAGLLGCLIISLAHGLKVVVISDIHYNVFYRPDISEENYCA